MAPEELLRAEAAAMPVAVDNKSTQAAMMLMRPLMPFPPDRR